MEAMCSSETLVDFQQTIWCYIPEDNTLDNAICAVLMIASMLAMEDIDNHLVKYITGMEG
jgi:hypothetical protein